MRNYITFAAFLLLLSCNQKENKDTMNKLDTITVKTERTSNETVKTDDTIHLNFIDRKGKFTIEGMLDSIHP